MCEWWKAFPTYWTHLGCNETTTKMQGGGKEGRNLSSS
jgi:hypothetical protein